MYDAAFVKLMAEVFPLSVPYIVQFIWPLHCWYTICAAFVPESAVLNVTFEHAPFIFTVSPGLTLPELLFAELILFHGMFMEPLPLLDKSQFTYQTLPARVVGVEKNKKLTTAIHIKINDFIGSLEKRDREAMCHQHLL